MTLGIAIAVALTTSVIAITIATAGIRRRTARLAASKIAKDGYLTNPNLITIISAYHWAYI